MVLVVGTNSSPLGTSSSCDPVFDINKTTFAGMTLDQVRTYYTQLQTAYLQLTSGGRPVVVSYEGKSVTYTPADASLLKNVMQEAAQLLGYGRQRRAMRPIFR